MFSFAKHWSHIDHPKEVSSGSRLKSQEPEVPDNKHFKVMKMDVTMINSGKAFFRPLILICGIAIGLSACGGGGSSSDSGGNTRTSSSAQVVVSPTPSIALSASKDKIWAGETVDVTFETKEATKCTSTPEIGLSGTSGTYTVKDLKPGINNIEITCTNGDKSTTKSVKVIVPLPVLPTSYENSKKVGVKLLDLPRVLKEISSTTMEITQNAFGYADFFQEGELSYIVESQHFVMNEETVHAGEIFFLKKVNGKYEDHTSEILDNKTGCITARKILIADFNKDKKPDVFMACSGKDFYPWNGEASIMLLSSESGKYLRKAIKQTEGAYTHGATAADIDGDGYPDIIMTDTRNQHTLGTSLRTFINFKNGDFVEDNSRVVAKMGGYFSVEIIDGKLYAGGDERTTLHYQDDYAETLVFTNNNGYFDSYIKLPYNEEFSSILDFEKTGDKLYTLRTNVGDHIMGVDFYTASAIQEINLLTLDQKIIYSHTGNYLTGSEAERWNLVWIDWITVENNVIYSVLGKGWYNLTLELK
jgi:hypothetical protein